MRLVRQIALTLAICACAQSDSARSDSSPMNQVAESYVKLALAVGKHDGDYVDAYYGPANVVQAAIGASVIVIPSGAPKVRRRGIASLCHSERSRAAAEARNRDSPSRGASLSGRVRFLASACAARWLRSE